MPELVRPARLRPFAIVIAAVSVMAIAGCGGDETKDQNVAPNANKTDVATQPGSTQQVSTIPIQKASGQGTSLSVNKPTLFEIKSASDLKSLQNKLNAGGMKPQLNVSSPDFGSRQMVALVLPPAVLGTQLAIATVKPTTKESYTVEATKLPPGKGCKKPSEKTVVFTIVETDKLTGSPKLKLTSQPQSPC